jgi:catechol 2,3-dioxygenase-like lactoylglutathione lyase family enzyme
MIKGLHHNAYRCRDSEETRRFYEGFLGLPLCHTLEIKESKSGPQDRHAAHLLPPGRRLLPRLLRGARHALRVQGPARLRPAYRAGGGSVRDRADAGEGQGRGIETRGVSDHGFIRSIYFRDPNGYVIELTAKVPGRENAMDPKTNGAREKLERWQAAKATRR